MDRFKSFTESSVHSEEHYNKIYSRAKRMDLMNKATKLAKKHAGDMTQATNEIDKLAKGLSDHPVVQRALQKHNESVKIYTKEAKDAGEYDQEGGMAKGQLKTMLDAAKELHDMFKDDDNLPEWVQGKITKATDYIDSARDYMKSQTNEAVDRANSEGRGKGYTASHEKGSKGYRAAMKDPKGKTSYLGSQSYKTKDAAEGEAKAYHKGYFSHPQKRTNDRGAQTAAWKYRQANKEYHAEEALDEARYSRGGRKGMEPTLKMMKAADALAAYGKKHGDIDKDDFMMASMIMRDGDIAGFEKFIKQMDTDPRDGIMVILKKHGLLRGGKVVKEEEKKEKPLDEVSRTMTPMRAKFGAVNPELKKARSAKTGLATGQSTVDYENSIQKHMKTLKKDPKNRGKSGNELRKLATLKLTGHKLKEGDNMVGKKED